MEPQKTGNHWSTKMGFITAPAMIIAGIVAYNYGDHVIGIGIAVFGIFRLGLLLGLMLKSKQ
jgi:hypothetical protein